MHMTHRDLLVLETLEDPNAYLDGELSDDGAPPAVSTRTAA